MTRDEIKEILQNTVANVTFTKKDGTERDMLCTLMPSMLPDLMGSSNGRSQDVLPVWDVENEGWRSFRVDSVIKVED